MLFGMYKRAAKVSFLVEDFRIPAREVADGWEGLVEIWMLLTEELSVVELVGVVVGVCVHK